MLGAGARPLVELRERRGARPAGRGRLGLFHFAILLPDRPALGRFVQHLADLGVHAGAGDHLVSEAFYLTDPDGLGIEVYADRPRESWRRNGRELLMATDPVDVAAVVAAGGDVTWTGMPEGTTMGHVHLHVGDLALASRFYSEALGLDRMVWSYPGALFLAAGGYHHHLGTNVWAGSGARAPEADQAQLLEWTLELPDAGSLRSAAASLVARGIRGRDRCPKEPRPGPGTRGGRRSPSSFERSRVMSQPRTRIEIWSDIACPWCYIGERRFFRALDARADREAFEVVFRPFELDPDAPAPGEPLRDRLAAATAPARKP